MSNLSEIIVNSPPISCHWARWLRASRSACVTSACAYRLEVSHKLIRLVSPLLLIVAAATNLRLANHSLYALLLTWHVAFDVSALVGWWLQRTGRRSVLFGAQLMFVALNATTIVALWDAVRGRFRATWQKS